MVRLPLRLSYPRRGRRDTHQLRHSRVPSVHLPPAHREYSRGCLPRSSPTLSLPLAPSPRLSLALTCHAVGRSARRSAATGVANSLLATSAPLGRFRAPAGGIRQYAPRCLAGKLYVVNRFPLLTDTCESSFLTSHEAERQHLRSQISHYLRAGERAATRINGRRLIRRTHVIHARGKSRGAIERPDRVKRTRARGATAPRIRGYR